MPLDGSEFKFEIDETTKLLIAARERIERGWCQRITAYGGSVCAVGALTRASGRIDPVSLNGALTALARAIYGSDRLEVIPPWNDTPGRTKEEVLAAYDAAIETSLSGSA